MSTSTILAVDDNPTDLKLLATILTVDGYDVLPAHSGELALATMAAMADQPPDLILLDIRMAGLSGFEVCRRLKEQATSREIPIIFISAAADSAETVEGFELGAVDFVSKPFRREELRARVRTQLELSRLRIQSDRHAAVLKRTNQLLLDELAARKLIDAALESSLHEKEGLLREAYHRVKNNLGLIISLMRLEAARSQVPETKAVLGETQARVRSVVLLNEMLYRTQSYSQVKLADYLRQVSNHLFEAHKASERDVRLVMNLEPVDVETAQAIPCGLIINELITNSLKHAFADGRAGEVRVDLQQDVEGKVLFRVSDTGAGLPEDFTSRQGQSLGLQLVSDLAKQLIGTLEVGPGATFTITFSPRPNPSTAEISRVPPLLGSRIGA